MLPRTPPHVAGKRPRRLLRFICPLPHAEVNRIAHRAEKIARPRDHSPAMRWQSGCFSSEQAHDLRSRDARSNFIHRNAADHAPGIQNEHRRFRDAAFFARVVDAPLAHHLPLRVAQNCKRQSQPIAHRLRFFRGVHRNGDQLCARRANRRILLAIVRQLAEAERSPVATIKKQHQRTRRAKFRESPRRPGRIRQLKIRSRLARLRRHVANRRCGTSHGYILNEWMPAPLRRFDAPHISCCAVAFFFRSARARCASCIPDDSAGRRFATQCSMAGIWLVGRCDTTFMPSIPRNALRYPVRQRHKDVSQRPGASRTSHFSSWFSARGFCGETCPFCRDTRAKSGDFRPDSNSIIFGIYRAFVCGCRSILRK